MIILKIRIINKNNNKIRKIYKNNKIRIIKLIKFNKLYQ